MLARSRCNLLIVVVLLCLATIPPPQTAGTGPDAPGVDDCVPEQVAGVGLACQLENGLFRVFDSEGNDLGTTHGPDGHALVEPGPNATWWPERQPACVDAATDTHYSQVVYAVAEDDEDRYDEVVDDVRTMVREANGIVDWSAQDSGGIHADLRVACFQGDIDVQHAVLPISRDGAAFTSIVEALKELGYDEPTLKYWVVYDHPIGGGIAGQAHVRDDDRAVADNAHNGGEAMYALTYGFHNSTMMHELAHNLGAVQHSAPHATGGWHCTDDSDVMCYEDGSCLVSLGGSCVDASTGGIRSKYRTGVCDVHALDCNHDDYFHADPPPGTYLATHWNLASSLNRFLQRGTSTLDAPDCTLRQATDQAVACTLQGGNPEADGVRYVVAWGDGHTTTSPSEPGGHAPGQPVEVEHTYASEGDYTLTLSAQDVGGADGTSTPVTLTVQVRDRWAPDELSVECPVYQERVEPVVCTAVAGDVDGNLLQYRVDWGDGSQPAWYPEDPVEPGALVALTHDYAAEGDFTARVTAVEADGEDGLASGPMLATVHLFDEDVTGPDIQIVDPAPGTLYFGCTQQADVPAGLTQEPVAVASGCMRVNVADAHTGVTSLRVQIPAACDGGDVTYAPPPAAGSLVIEYPICAPGEAPITVTATDGLGNVETTSVTVGHVPGAQPAVQVVTPILQGVVDLALKCVPSSEDVANFNCPTVEI